MNCRHHSRGLWTTRNAVFPVLSFLLLGTACSGAGPDAISISKTSQALTFQDPPGGLTWNYVGNPGGYSTGTVGDTAPALSSWGADRLDVYYNQGNTPPFNSLAHRAFYEGQWHPMELLGGFLLNQPAAVSWGPNRADVIAMGGSPYAVWHRGYDYFAGGWGPWDSLGGQCAPNTSLSISSWQANRLDVFAQAIDDTIWHRAWNNAWGNWEPISGTAAHGSGVGSVSTAVNTVDIFAIFPDQQMYTLRWNNGWGNWMSIGAPPGGINTLDVGPNGDYTTRISAAVASPGHAEVFITNAVGKIYSRVYPYNYGWTLRDTATIPGGVSAIRRGSSYDLVANVGGSLDQTQLQP